MSIEQAGLAEMELMRTWNEANQKIADDAARPSWYAKEKRDDGDSDDEYDNRRNRDKFRRERDDFGGNRVNHNRGGGDWNDGR